jgi:hypothetical protein
VRCALPPGSRTDAPRQASSEGLLYEPPRTGFCKVSTPGKSECCTPQDGPDEPIEESGGANASWIIVPRAAYILRPVAM